MAVPMEQIQTDQYLIDFVVGLTNAEFIAEQVMTVSPVRARKGTYFKYGKEVFTPEYDIREPYARAREVRHEYTRASFEAIPHALSEPVSWDERDEARANGTPFDPYMDATELVQEKLALGRELDVADMLRNTASYASGHNVTLAGTTQFSDYTNSNPESVFRTARTTVRPKIAGKFNVAVVPDAVYQILRRHPQVKDYFDTESESPVSRGQLAEFLEVEELYVPESVYNNAPAGRAENLVDIWGKDIVLLRRERTARRRQITFGKIFRVRYPSGNYNTEVRRWTEGDRKVDMVEAEFLEARHIIAPEAGYVIKNAVA